MGYQLNTAQFNSAARILTQGIAVSRATAALPQSASAAIFNITGGRILVVDIVGEVTTVIQTQTNNTKLLFNPTGAGSSTDLCATTDITADAVGTLYSITGTPATALQDALWCITSNKALARPLILSEGAIELSCSASNTGSVAWDIVYVPLDTGAAVAAA